MTTLTNRQISVTAVGAPTYARARYEIRVDGALVATAQDARRAKLVREALLATGDVPGMNGVAKMTRHGFFMHWAGGMGMWVAIPE